MLSDQDISVRRLTYRCCALSSLSAAIDARIHGDKKCYEENKRKWLWLSWAAAVMQDTPVDGIENGCTLLPFASDVAEKADCLCRPAPCPVPDEDCAITPAFTVLEALAFADLPVSPPEDSAYYVISGNTLGVGSIATWDGAAYVYTSVPNGSIVWATVTNDYWINTGGGPGPYFPPPILTQIQGPPVYLWFITSSSPQTTAGRDVQLQGLGPNGWYNMSPVFNESQFPYTLFLAGLPYTAIRLAYIIEECAYYSAQGSFVPPITPPADCTIIPAFTVDQAVDASQYGTLPSGRYLIATNQFGLTNLWSDHLGEVVDTTGPIGPITGVFTPVPVYGTVYDIASDSYWWNTMNGVAPYFTPLTLEQTTTGYDLYSNWPSQSAAGNRWVSIEGLSGSTWLILWGGFEYDLPQVLPPLAQVSQIRITYVLPGPCEYVITGNYIPLPEDYAEDIVCGTAPTEYQVFYNYLNEPFNSQFVYTSPNPLETVTVTFISGSLPNTNILIFDGTLDTNGPQIGTIIGPQDLNGQLFSFTSSGQSLTVYFVSDPPPTQATPIWWQVNCSLSSPVTGTVTPVDDCGNYVFSLDVDVLSTGDGATVTIEYIVDGGDPQEITGAPAGITAIGPFNYNSEVIVRLTAEDNANNTVVIGVFGNHGYPVCPDPCAPADGYKVNALGDLADLPEDPGLPNYGYFVTTDNTGIGTWPVGSLLGWNDPGTGYEWQSVSYTPGIIISDGVTYWVAGGLGVQPYNVFPVPTLSLTGNTPLNWAIFVEEIQQFSMPQNTPMALEVRNGFSGWSQAWTGTLQQLVIPLAISIPQPFTEARIVWNYDTCGFIGGVMITLTAP